MINKKVDQYNVFNSNQRIKLNDNCEFYNDCSFRGGASFDSEGDLLVPSGDVFDDNGNWLGYQTFVNQYMPTDTHPIADCFDISIEGIENYDINESWYQQSDLLNQDFKIKGCLHAPGYPTSAGSYHFCTENNPSSTGYNKFRLFFAIGTDNENGFLYGNISPYYNDDPDYIYRYKNRTIEQRDKLYVWAVVVFIGDHIDYHHLYAWDNDKATSNLTNNDCDRTSICTYFVKKIGEFKGDYKFVQTNAYHVYPGGGGSYYISVLNSDFCGYKYDNGDLDLRNISFIVTGDDLWSYHSNPAIRYQFEPDADHSFPGFYSRDLSVPLCNFDNFQISVNGSYYKSYNKNNYCVNSDHGYSFLAQQPSIFNPGFKNESNFGLWQYKSWVQGSDYLYPSGIVGFDWCHGGPYGLYMYWNEYSHDIFDGYNDDQKELVRNSNNCRHYGYLTNYLTLEISGVKSSDSLNNIENATDFDCYSSDELNGEYELEASSPSSLDFRTYHTGIDAICCDCWGSFSWSSSPIDSGCVIDFYVNLDANENTKNSESKLWYSTKLTASIAGHTYEYDFNNWGLDSDVDGFLQTTVYPRPIDFNNLEVIPKLVDSDVGYAHIHDFSEASVKIKFGNVNSYDCLPNATRCTVFYDEIGPDNLLVNIPNDWTNQQAYREYNYYNNNSDTVLFKVKCGSYDSYVLNDDTNQFEHINVSECKWIRDGITGYSWFDTDPLDWCQNLPFGQYILTNVGECTWSFYDDCQPTGIVPDENDTNNFFEFEEETDLYEALYDDNVDDLYLYGMAPSTSEVSNNCKQVEDVNTMYKIPFTRNDYYPYPIYSFAGGANRYCPSACIKLYIFPYYGDGSILDQQYTNQFKIKLEISQISTDRENSDEYCPNAALDFIAYVNSAPGSQILDAYGRPMYRYYITKEMLNGLELEYQPAWTGGDTTGGPVGWGGSSITLYTVD